MQFDNHAVGDTIRKLRLQKGMTQELLVVSLALELQPGELVAEIEHNLQK